MNRDELDALFAQREGLWRRRDSASLAKGHAEDGIVESPLFGIVRGRAAIEESYASLFRAFQDSTVEFHGRIIDGAHVVQLFKMHATHASEMFGLPATNRQFTIQGAFVEEMKDGHIAHERRIYDFTGMLVQIGVLRPRPAKD
jgi:steroid delta-isomerase-like uncharacterized protein